MAPAGAAAEDSVERMEATVTDLAGLGPRPAGSEAEHAAARYLADRLARLGGTVVTEPVPLPDARTSANVWTDLGAGRALILVGAHYDTHPESPGADDNGSGVAVILEAARILAAEPAAGLRVRIVFFGAEERIAGADRNAHHHGSRRMAAALAAAGALPEAMVSVDMVGWGDELLAASLAGTDGTVASELAAVAAASGLAVRAVERGDISDHEAFARHGVGAAMLWRPDNPAYHDAADDSVRSGALAEDLDVLLAWVELRRPVPARVVLRRGPAAYAALRPAGAPRFL